MSTAPRNPDAATLPAPLAPPVGTDPLDAAAEPWYVKTPGTRPDQASITVNPDHIINRQGKDFVLYAGLLDAAHRAGLQSIQTMLVQAPSSTNGGTTIVHATVEFRWGTFTGLGDADIGNVSRNIAPHQIRMAETRAKARALRDALNVGMVAMEEMGPEPPAGGEPTAAPAARPSQSHQSPQSPQSSQTGQMWQQGQAPGATRNPATPKQIETIQRLSRQQNKEIATDGLTRAQASDIITSLIGS